MSLKTRLGLLASSSLAAATITATSFTAVSLAPTAAFAYDECLPANGTTLSDGQNGVSDPTLNGAAADSFACAATGANAAPGYPSGITYSSQGNLTVSKTGTGITWLGANGINLTGNGADDVTWNSLAGIVASSGNVAGPLLDVVTGAGNITIAAGFLAAGGTATNVTHGIRATSTGDGDISITSTSSLNATGASGVNGIEAVTNGGAINITGSGSGRLRGILAQTSGAGTISLNLTGAGASTVDGVAAIDTVTGTGATNISITGGTVSGGAGAAIRSVSDGSVTIQQSGAFNTVSGRVDFSEVAGGVNWTATSSGLWQSSGSSIFSEAADTLTVNGTLAAGGVIDLGNGGDTFNVAAANGSFTANGTITFGAGTDQLNVAGIFNADGAILNFGADADTLAITGAFNATNALIDFGTGADQLDQQSGLFANGVTTIANLEAFNNSGSIYLGSGFGGATDGNTNDRLVVSSGVFTGSGDSRIFLDAFLGDHESQLGCAVAVVADCVDFTGATTAGATMLVVQDASFDINAGTLGSVVTLVQGSTAADHFTLDPASSYYTETGAGPALRKPVVAYYFRYDEENERHVLIGAPTDEPFQVGTFATAAQETWRATTGSWLTRQADLRATPGGLSASRGVWGRISGQSSERETVNTYSAGSVDLDFDLSQKQRIVHLNFGGDLVTAPGLVLGATVGFVRSDVEFEATPTEAAMTGFSGGLYASYVAGPLFIDGIFNSNILHVKADAPQMGLGEDVPMKFDLKSLGGQVEAGWRIPLGLLFVEPLAGVSFVETMIDDAEAPGGSGFFEFDKTRSIRLGGGARVGMDSHLAGMKASYSLTGRYWNEKEGESAATITTASGSSALLADDFGGGFSEVIGSLNLYSDDGGLSGFVNLGGKFADNYESVDGAAGVRVRW